MHIGVIAEDTQKQWFTTKFNSRHISIQFLKGTDDNMEPPSPDALFILEENCYHSDWIKNFKGPVFINEVILTLSDLNLPANFHRINGWNTFLERINLEVASRKEADAKDILDLLDWQPVFCPDIPGFVSARVIAMIINEAYFAMRENISSTAEIDLALKLGTNYPYGPFEWANKIGLQRIYDLLTILSAKSERYLVAPGLKQAIIQKY